MRQSNLLRFRPIIPVRQISDQFAHADTQSNSNPLDVADRDVALAAFDGANVIWMKITLAKSVRKERMVENLDVFDFQLDEADVARIAALETGKSSFFSHRDPAMVKWMSERRLDI